MVRALHDKNGWNSLLQKLVEITAAKLGGTGVIDTLTEMAGAIHDKKRWNSLWQKWLELVL